MVGSIKELLEKEKESYKNVVYFFNGEQYQVDI